MAQTDILHMKNLLLNLVGSLSVGGCLGNTAHVLPCIKMTVMKVIPLQLRVMSCYFNASPVCEPDYWFSVWHAIKKCYLKECQQEIKLLGRGHSPPPTYHCAWHRNACHLCAQNIASHSRLPWKLHGNIYLNFTGQLFYTKTVIQSSQGVQCKHSRGGRKRFTARFKGLMLDIFKI